MALCESTTLKYLLYKNYKRSRANSFIYDDRLVFGEFYHLYPQLRTDDALFRSYTKYENSKYYENVCTYAATCGDKNKLVLFFQIVLCVRTNLIVRTCGDS